MNALLLFEVGRSSSRWPIYLITSVLILAGVFCGNQFNLTVGEGIYLNSPYTIGYMTGILSLIIIFLAIIYAGQILFRDWDSRFDVLIFSYPISKRVYLQGRFLAFFLQTFLSFIFLITGFVIGQNFRAGSEMQPSFNFFHYLYPLLVFGGTNSFLICSFLFFVSFSTKRKLTVVIGGLFLYVVYMIILIFSNSPFMSGSLPQSQEAQQLSALTDPFGISAYFFEAKNLSVSQKNEVPVPFSGYFLINRMIFSVAALLFLFFSYRFFSFSSIAVNKNRNRIRSNTAPSAMPYKNISEDFTATTSLFDFKAEIESVLSFAKIDLIYLFKSIIIVAASILLLFFIGMEMYAEIEKGIRLPQNYASSGLMSVAILENFYFFGILIMVYFINDLYWRSHSSGFSLIEKSNYFFTSKLTGHFLSASILLFFLSFLLIMEGVAFQLVYGYFHIDWNAYAGVILFNTFPLIIFAAFILLVNDNIKNRFAALGVSVLIAYTLTTPVSKKIIAYPLLRIFSDYRGTYSDFNGYGIYVQSFAERLLFGAGLLSFLWLVNEWTKTKKQNSKKIIIPFILLVAGSFAGHLFMKDYIAENEDDKILQSVRYEQKFKKYEQLPQPIVTDVVTQIHLYPSENSYTVNGTYQLINQTEKPVQKILINFHHDLKIESAVFRTASESKKIDQHISEIYLKHPLKPGEKANLDFKISYHWFAVNGHDPFNAIIANGSFMRISRYFPAFGYQNNNEIDDKKKRAEFKLRKQPELKRSDAPEVFRKDFINLDMTVSTEKEQSAVGTGDLIDSYSKNNRNYFRYKAGNIPFRFAISSAKYQVKSIVYKGITINVLYHEKHSENVEHLIENVKRTLDYCTRNFDKYPYKTVNFAEVSSFTQGFAATAYPSAVFMTEDLLFHANIHADKQQDVINELAGHELSHLWWGNSNIDPDDREGAVMLTETLAMYTEMMLYKKMHGRKKMMDKIQMHQQIYDREKGLSQNQPLCKVKAENTHISYSKGAVAMVRLSDIVGEEKVNKALRNFLLNNQYPKKPSSSDLLREFYAISPDESVRKKIKVLFESE